MSKLPFAEDRNGRTRRVTKRVSQVETTLNADAVQLHGNMG